MSSQFGQDDSRKAITNITSDLALILRVINERYGLSVPEEEDSARTGLESHLMLYSNRRTFQLLADLEIGIRSLKSYIVRVHFEGETLKELFPNYREWVEVLMDVGIVTVEGLMRSTGHEIYVYLPSTTRFEECMRGLGSKSLMPSNVLLKEIYPYMHEPLFQAGENVRNDRQARKGKKRT